MSIDPSKLTRRELLGLLGAAGAAALAGCSPPEANGSDHLAGLDCVVTPEQTEGPYFVDERLNRSDIRSDPATGAVRPGVPLRLQVQVSRVSDQRCAPLAGALVDLWQCDALGVYSDVQDLGGLFDTRGQKFLRGYQLTDAAGAASFLTVYPGWYQGRTVHLHFKVRATAEGKAHEFTSQLYFDDELTDRVHKLEPYAAKGTRDTRNNLDRIYASRESGARLLVPLAEEGEGYAGVVRVGLRLA